jgi:glyoxalase family protein
MLKTQGIHHITAITSDAEKIYQFMTEVLGLRLAKKTVNQDDIQTYHLFFTDAIASPGTDLTFFDFKGSSKRILGTNSIRTIGLRVPSFEALSYFVSRFDKLGVKHEGLKKIFDMDVLPFVDFDEQHYMLVSDEGIPGVKPGIPWHDTDILEPYRIVGLGPIEMIVKDLEVMHHVLKNWMHYDLIHSETHMKLYHTGLGGNGARILIREEGGASAVSGYGSVHHAAFSVHDDKELHQWIEHLNHIPARHSGFVDRFYFHSLYTRLHPGILFEFATEGPGFVDDEESLETLGTTLALPPKLRPLRKQIEEIIKPIHTSKGPRL